MEAYDCIDQLQLEHSPSALQLTHHWLHRLQQQLHLSTDLVFRMDLVLNELIPNILEHGGISAAAEVPAPPQMLVRLLKSLRGYALEISDGGPAFNPLQHHYVPATDLYTASVSGRGIHLVKTFTEHQCYAYQSGRNVLTVTFYAAQLD